ncbi:MAG: MFS transporter [Nitrososphaerota archaeon]
MVTKYRWVILAVTVFVSVVAAINYFKPPPIMPILIETFGLNYAMASLLMSSFSISAVVISLPTGTLTERFGPKMVGSLMLICLTIGSIVGSFAPNYETLLTSRFLEGFAFGSALIFAPALITMWFPPNELGKALGIFAPCVPIGMLLSYAVAPTLVVASWQNVWWFTTLLSIIACILFVALVKTPPVILTDEEKKNVSEVVGAYKNVNVWLVAFGWLCFNFAAIGFSTWLPTHLTEIGYPLAVASLVATIPMIMCIPTGPIAGAVVDRIKSMKKPIVTSCVLSGIAFPLYMYSAGNLWVLIAYAIVLGTIWGFTPAPTLASSGALLGPRLASVGLGIINFMSNIGYLIGPLVLGVIIPIGWSVAFVTLSPICFVAAIAVTLAKKLR